MVGYPCPCHLPCGEKFDTYVRACLGGMRHYSIFARVNAIIGSENGARGFAIQSAHWFNEAQRACKDKS